MYKRSNLFLHFLLIIVLLTGTVSAREVKPPEPKAEAYLLVEISSGKVLSAHNEDERLYPASTTKMLTALLAIELAALNEMVTVGEEIDKVGPGSSRARLRRGDVLTVEQLLYALLLPSGNDAAHVLAVYLARLEHGDTLSIDEALEAFAAMMNERAAELGAVKSNFVTPDGYHHPDHYSTANDLAAIFFAAWQHDILRTIASTPRYVWESGNRELSWLNTNMALHPFLEEHYDSRVTGFKTGYTPQAGACLIATARQGERELLAIILNSDREHRYPDTRQLLDYGFDSHGYRSVLTPGRVLTMMPVVGQAPGGPETVGLKVVGYYGDLFRNDQSLEFHYQWDTDLMVLEGEEAVFLAPLQANQRVGTVQIILDGQVLTERGLYVARDVVAARPLPRFLMPAVLTASVLAILAALLASYSVWRKTKKSSTETGSD